jgi:hypothetical protein
MEHPGDTVLVLVRDLLTVGGVAGRRLGTLQTGQPVFLPVPS